jgi:serine/threonine-protein kinase
MLQEGTVFAGRYRVARRIASGGMGAVYEVVHLETERRRALKVMLPHILESQELRERFKLEAKVAAQIESDFIVDVFDAGVDETTSMPFLVMELLRGEDLGTRVKRLGRLPPEEAVLYLHQTALALDKTHKASIVHRDLKPENLFIAEREDSPPRIKVLDFGIAKIVAESATKPGATTQSVGTPLYMSPEQFNVNPVAKLSGAADIFALGMIAYTLLVGVSYWFEEAQVGNLFAMVAAAVDGPPQPATVRASARGVMLPAAFDPWFAGATARRPADRFPTATAAVRALAEVFGVPLPRTGSLQSPSELSFSPSRATEGAPTRPSLTSVPDPMAPTVLNPEATSPGASMTQPLSQERRKDRFVAIGLALGMLGVGASVGYAVHAWRAPSEAMVDEKTQVARSAAIAEASAPPLMAPAGAPSAPEPVVSIGPLASAMASASPKSEPSSMANSPRGLPPKEAEKPAPIKPAKVSSARSSAPASSTPSATALRRKYTPE